MAQPRESMTRVVVAAVLIGALGGLAGGWWRSRGGQAPSGPGGTVTSAPAPSDAPRSPTFAQAAAPAGQALSRVSLLVHGAGPTPIDVEVTRTLDDGAVLRLGRVPADAEGRCTLHVAAGRYLLAAFAGPLRGDAALEVPADRDVELLLELEASWAAHLRVVSKDSGRPVPAATATLTEVRAASHAAHPVASQVWTGDSLGRLYVDGLPAGEVRVEVRAPGHRPDSLVLAQAQDGEQEVALDESAFVTGTVRDENGTPLGGVSVSIGGADDQTRTSADGRFQLGAPAGTRLVLAKDPAGRSAWKRVEVPAGGTAANVELRLGEPLRLHGEVVEAGTGAKVAGAEVVAEVEQGVVVARATSTEAGRFDLEGVPSGWVSLEAHQGQGGLSDRVAVESGSAASTTLRVQAPAAVWGTVKDAQGQAVQGAEVTLSWTHWLGPEPRVVTTDETGTFRLDDARPGAARLDARLGPDAESTPVNVQLSPATASRVDLVLEASAVIVGQVHAAAQVPCDVTAYSGDAAHHDARTTVSAPDGHYRLKLPPGEWKLSAVVSGELHGPGTVTVKVAPGAVAHQDLTARGVASPTDQVAEFGSEPGTLGASLELHDGQVVFSWLQGQGPAARAGVLVGDALLKVDGEAVKDLADAWARTQGAPGSAVVLEVSTAGAPHTLSATRAKSPGGL